MIDSLKINEIINRIVESYNPDKIILFGSYASGNPNEDSDLDLLVIKETDMPRFQREFEIYKSLIGSMVPVDILAYTGKELEQEKADKYSFLNSAVKSSKILYERKKQYNKSVD